MSSREFRVLFASDGSSVAKTAVRVGARFPWPSGSVGYGVVARQVPREQRLSVLLTALDQTSERVAKNLSQALRRRWPTGPVNVVEAPPVDAVLTEASRIMADAIVVGWRGHGAVRRLLAGSVSRGVVRGASCPVLVVHRARSPIQRIVVGVDGSDNSHRAIDLVARFEVPTEGRVTLFTAAELLQVPTQGLVPAIAGAGVVRAASAASRRPA